MGMAVGIKRKKEKKLTEKEKQMQLLLLREKAESLIRKFAEIDVRFLFAIELDSYTEDEDSLSFFGNQAFARRIAIKLLLDMNSPEID